MGLLDVLALGRVFVGELRPALQESEEVGDRGIEAFSGKNPKMRRDMYGFWFTEAKDSR
jgi:hypothetical protein